MSSATGRRGTVNMSAFEIGPHYRTPDTSAQRIADALLFVGQVLLTTSSFQ